MWKRVSSGVRGSVGVLAAGDGERGRPCQARMASISGLTPKIAITRFML